jgi:predicted RecA/RadA family phage recombinase
MKNYVQEGDILTLTAPYAVTSGDGFLVGSIFAIASTTAASGATVEGVREGVFSVTALSTDTFTVGAKVYWDNTNKRCTSTASGNTLIGVATVVKASGATTVTVLLDGVIR